MKPGNWLISCSPGQELAALGVFVGQSKKPGALLGVLLKQTSVAEVETNEVVISQVVIGSAADRANLWVNDVIRSIDDERIPSIAQLKTVVGSRKPYDQIKLSIARGDEELTFSVKLAESHLPSTTAQRRLYFEHGIEHDSKFKKNQCGGAIVNLTGQIVGINVLNPAHLPGAIPLPDDSYTSLAVAIPINEVIPILESLKSGELAPAKVNQDRIELLDRKVTEMRDSLSGLSEQEQELIANIKDIADTIKRQKALVKAFSLVRKKSLNLQRQLKQMEEELKRLQSGFDD